MSLNCAIHGSVVQVAAYFFFGREDVIPDMFQRLLSLWDHGAVEVPYFAYYLKRHIELDGDSHGPWAREMLITLAGPDERRWKQATRAAELAITAIESRAAVAPPPDRHRVGRNAQPPRQRISAAKERAVISATLRKPKAATHWSVRGRKVADSGA